MLDSFAVKSKFSTFQATVLRLVVAVAAVAIAFLNFSSTCSPYYDTTYSKGCQQTLLPSGTQLFYDQLTMTTEQQLQKYDGFHPTNCTVYNTTIQEVFSARFLPTFKIFMGIQCNDNVRLTVQDFNFNFWNDNYQAIITTAGALMYYELPAGSVPHQATEFKYGWTSGTDNSMRMFTASSYSPVITMPPDDDLTVFYLLMQTAKDEVEGGSLPGVEYLCYHCGTKASWTGGLIWKFILDTANTAATALGLCVFILTLFIKDSLRDLIRKYQQEEGEGMVPLVGKEP
ncbi:hypothetical protein EMPS_02263 [Entomortierella parvispora]|uniref:Uncharacterized protein n=1 Tax=Entomortierella parvispora TaxID=205924 RepID=A0A9P3H4E8_9FUNG|nr:hypothetical protein EMPS_02263 [Entomortierella parvispora]